MRPIFIIGPGRNGTTMLGSMLGNHPNYVTVPEGQFKEPLFDFDWDKDQVIAQAFAVVRNHPTFKIWGVDIEIEEFNSEIKQPDCRAFIEWLVLQYNKYGPGKNDIEVWIDHDPRSHVSIEHILDVFPDAIFIHVVRDGRAVAASMLPLDWGPNSIIHAAYHWSKSISAINMRAHKVGDERIIRVYYEDILNQPEPTLRKVCEAAQLDFRQEMLEGKGFFVPEYTRAQHTLVGGLPDVSRIDGWKQELSDRQIEIFESIAGDLLKALNYPLVHDNPKPPNLMERAYAKLYEKCKRLVNERNYRKRVRSGIIAAHKSPKPTK